MASVLKVDKLDPQSGTALEIGTSGDTVSIPSGATLDISASTLTPPATLPASSGVNLTALNATNLGSGTVPTARLGTGTASSSTVLYGDNTWAATGETNTSFQVKHVAGQTISDQTITKVLFDTVKFDTASGYDTGNDRYVIQTGDDGKWLFWFKGGYRTGDDANHLELKLYKNGSIIDQHRFINRYYQTYTGAFALDLVATDYIEIFVWTLIGGDVTLAGGDDAEASSLGGMLMEA